MKQLWGISLMIVVLTGCGRGADGVVREYRNQQNCLDRTKFVLAPEAMRSKMSEHYKDLKDCRIKTLKVEAEAACKDLATGDYCAVTAYEDEKASSNYCVTKAADGFKIDWPCSVGYNAMSLQAAKATRAAKVRFRVGAQLTEPTSSFGANYFAATMRTDGGMGWGYARKESTGGKKLLDALKDGRQHALIVELSHRDGDDFDVLDVIATNWRQTDEEAGTAIPSPDEKAAPAPAPSASPPPSSTAMASAAPEPFSLGPVKGLPEDCAALTACCSATNLPQTARVACMSVGLGSGFPDCARNLKGVRELIASGGGTAPPGCAPAKAVPVAAKTSDPAAARSPTPGPARTPQQTVETPKEPPAHAGGGAPFDRGAAASALGAVSVQSCKRPDGPTGSGHVKVTFAPDGSASAATVNGPFAGTDVGTCIEAKYRSARVPAFNGTPTNVGKSFTIN